MQVLIENRRIKKWGRLLSKYFLDWKLMVLVAKSHKARAWMAEQLMFVVRRKSKHKA